MILDESGFDFKFNGPMSHLVFNFCLIMISKNQGSILIFKICYVLIDPQAPAG